jgi:hypothetical protein
MEPPPVEPRGTRTYHVAADEVNWDYAPSGREEAMGHPFDDDFSSMRILRCRGIHFDQPEVIQQRLRTGR